MDRKRKIIIITVVIVVLLVSLFLVVALLDLMSYTATDADTMEPEGEAVGTALVVYSPGLSGQAREAAEAMADAICERGYRVTLAGVRSDVAGDTSGYDIIIAGGPMYGGKVSSSIAGFVDGLDTEGDFRLGVFATTGGSEPDDDALSSLEDQVSSLTDDLTPQAEPVVRLILTEGVEEDCSQMVEDLVAGPQ